MFRCLSLSDEKQKETQRIATALGTGVYHSLHCVSVSQSMTMLLVKR